MAAALTDKFRKSGTSTVTTLASPGKEIGASSINVGSTTNYPSDTGVIVTIRVVDSNGILVAGTQTEFKGIVAGATSITIDPTPVYGTDQVYAAGSTTQVLIALSSFAHNDMVDGLLVSHNQDGTLKTGIVTTDKLAAKHLAGWDLLASSGARVSAIQFTVAGNVTAYLSSGLPIEYTDTTTKYGNVASSSYSAPNTTITLDTNSDYALVDNPTNIYFGNRPNPVGFPEWFAYNGTPYGSGGSAGAYSEDHAISKFKRIGKDCRLINHRRILNKGSWSGSLRIPLPISGSTDNEFMYGSSGVIYAQTGLTTRGVNNPMAGSYISFTADIANSDIQWTTVQVNDWISVNTSYSVN